MASYARVKIKKDQNPLNKAKQKLSRQFKLIRPMCSLYTCLRTKCTIITWYVHIYVFWEKFKDVKGVTSGTMPANISFFRK